MKAKKLLAVLLAILMVIPAMVLPTAAETPAAANAATESNVTEYRFTVLAENEKLYWNQAYAGRTNDNGRYGEAGGMRYEFPLTSDLMPTEVSISGFIYNDVYFKVSFDGINFFDAYKTTARVGGGYHTFDLDANGELAKAWDAAWVQSGKPTKLYLHVDNVCIDGAETGWGTFIDKKAETVVTVECDPTAPQTKYWTTVFTPNVDSTPYQYALNASGVDNATKNCWYLDEGSNMAAGTGIIQFAYAMTDSQLPEKLTWTAKVGQNLMIDFSVDNQNWVELFNEVPDGNSNIKYYTFDLIEAGYLDMVEAAPSSMLYIRLKNSKPGYGWGGCINKEPVTLCASYGEQEISGDFITLDWTVHGEDESNYYVGGATSKPTYYYVDRDAKGVMRYPITNADLSSQILWTSQNNSQFLLEVSLDGTNYVEAFRYNNDGVIATTPSVTTGFPSVYRTYDLTAAVKEAAKTATSKDNLYVRWGDSHPGDGWGGQVVENVTLNVRSAEGMEYLHVIRQDIVTGPIALKADNTNYYFTATPDLPWVEEYRGGQTWGTINPSWVDATGETPVLTGGITSGPSNYYADGGYYVLRYELPEGANTWQFTATIGNKFGLYVAYGDMTAPHPITDSDRYTPLAAYTDFGLSGMGTYITNYTITKTASEQELANGRYVYLLFADNPWYQGQLTGNPVAGGYGAAILLGKNYPITMSAYLSTEDELLSTTNVGYDEYAHTIKESFSLSKVYLNNDKTKHTLYETEPVLVASATTATISTDIKSDVVRTDENGNLYTTGDGNYNGRYGDGNRVTVYRYELPKYATKLDWTARVGGDYGIYMAYADANATDIQWTLVKNYLEDINPATQKNYVVGEHPNSTKMTISDDISADELAKGYVYLKFVDYDYVLYPDGYTPEGAETAIATGGYGCRIALGSNYPVEMSWTVTGEDRDFAVNVTSATPTLTNNINLTFKIDAPASAKSADVTIAWANGAPISYEMLDADTYIVKDILPQQMAQDLVINFNGICMDNTQYTAKTFTYSMKDYCQRMISKHSGDAELVALLSDALVYGAAAQAYVFDDGELATDGIVGLKPSTFTALNADDYANVLSRQATAEDAYQWAGVTLVLDNTVAIRYTLYTKVAAPTVYVNNVPYTPVAVDGAANYYTVDVPVYAGSFATEYVASFDGVDGYSVTYSVDHYVARNYDPSQKLTSALIAALYNYGASAAAYN